MGSVYRPKLKSGEPCTIWWIKFYVAGKPVKESTHSTKEADAKRLLKEREGRVVRGEAVVPRVDRTTYEQARADLEAHYRANGKRDLKEFLRRVPPLDAFFRGRRINTITQSDVDRYINARLAQGRQPATVTRELGSLTTLLRLQHERGTLQRLPILHKPKPGAARQGFFEKDAYESVRRQLPEDLQAAVTLAYTFGWRTQSEVLTLEKRHLDLAAGTLRLDPGMTKNGDGRVVYLTPELITLLTAQLAHVVALERARQMICPYLFPHLTGPLAGKPRYDFKRAWYGACQRAGLAGRMRHDFRRTAVRNLVNAGVPEKVAMTITGHKTRAVFDRYHIVSPGDLQDAARKLAGLPPRADGPVHGPVPAKPARQVRVKPGITP